MAEIKKRNTLTTPIVAANLAKVTKVLVVNKSFRLNNIRDFL